MSERDPAKWRQENPERFKLQMKEYRQRVGEDHLKEYALKHKYDLTLKDYMVLFNAQNGKCAICGEPEKALKKKLLAVDHDHQTGKIRGLLCQWCNRALGLFKDDTGRLSKAILYLAKGQNVEQ